MGLFRKIIILQIKLHLIYRNLIFTKNLYTTIFMQLKSLIFFKRRKTLWKSRCVPLLLIRAGREKILKQTKGLFARGIHYALFRGEFYARIHAKRRLNLRRMTITHQTCLLTAFYSIFPIFAMTFREGQDERRFLFYSWW